MWGGVGKINDVVGDYAYISSPFGVIIVNISDANHPKLISRTNSPSMLDRNLDNAVKGEIIFSAFREGGIVLFNSFNKSSPVFLSENFVGEKAVSVFISGKNAYIADYYSGLKVISIENITYPRYLSYLEIGSNIKKLFVVGSYAYLACGSAGIRIVDIFNPTKVKIAGELDTNQAFDIFADEDGFFCYIADWDSMKIIDVRNKTNPKVIGTIEGDSQSKGIAVCGNFAYFSDKTTMKVINITDKFDPFIVGSVDVKDADGIDCLDDYVYLACSNYGINIIDVSDKTYPFIVSTFGTYNAKTVKVVGNTAYVSDDRAGLKLVSLDDKVNPSLVATYPSRETKDAFIENDHIFIADGDYGIKVVKTSLKLEGSSSFPSFCGDTQVFIVASCPNSGINISTSFQVSRPDICNGHGECSTGGTCKCHFGYEGERCESWYCFHIEFKQNQKVCSGHGSCIKPDLCACDSLYYGTNCNQNLLYVTVVAPGAILGSGGIIIGVSIVLISICCCITLLCCLGILVFFISLCCCSVIVFYQTLGLRKFGQLKDFDLLLKEQKLDQDQSIAHLRIDKTLFQIPLDEITLMKVLGEGGSASTVYMAKWKGQMVAFKCFKTRQLCDNQDNYDEFEREVQILGSVSHPNILQFLGCSVDPPRIGILMEFCEKGDLAYFLRMTNQEDSNSLHSYPLKEKLRMCLEISSAMEYLHSRNIIHRDLKLENVLVDSSEKTKLMDFGLSKITKRMSEMKTKRIGTSYYMSPEIVLSNNYNEKCDVFSFAIMVFIIITENFFPYGIEAVNVEVRVATDPNMRPSRRELEEKLPEDCKWVVETLLSCWDYEPYVRHSFSDIVKIFETWGNEDYSGNKKKNNPVSTPQSIFEEENVLEKEEEDRELLLEKENMDLRKKNEKLMARVSELLKNQSDMKRYGNDIEPLKKKNNKKRRKPPPPIPGPKPKLLFKKKPPPIPSRKSKPPPIPSSRNRKNKL